MKKSLLLIVFSSFLFGIESKLEYGFGLATLTYPVYIGSKDTKTMIVPYPYIDYTMGDFTINRDGFNQKLFNIDGLSASLSGSGMLPIKSDRLRSGMKELDLAVELGCSIDYELYNANNWVAKLELPVRSVFATDFSRIHYEGVISDPKLTSKYTNQGYIFEVSSGPVFANAKYHDYYYGVPQSDATPTRPSYEGKGGYSGTKTSTSITKRIDNYWFGGFLKYYNLNGAAFANSPLTETNHALYGGIAVAYIF